MTRSLGWYWEAGGMGMYPLTLLLMLGVALALVALVFLFADRSSRALRPLAIAVAGVAALVLVTGGATFASTRSQAQAAVQHVNPADREVILQAADEEARIPLMYGLLIAAPLLATAIAVSALRRS